MNSWILGPRTRDGLTLSYTYDAANRPTSVVPSGEVAATLEALDAGDATTWDVLSRPVEQRRGDASLKVAYPSYDLGGRPAEEKVGQREALGWAWDLYSRPIETRLPAGVGRSSGSFTGFTRQFDSLDRLKDIGALGTEPQSVTLGATWSWGGGGRLWGVTTKGSLGTAMRLGYLGGPGAQPPAGNTAESKWRLGTLTWGSMPGADAETTATASPSQIWGRFGYGYRGNEGDPRDGAKVGRLAVPVGRDLFAGIGWSWDYDAGVRLSEATAGRGELLGGNEDNNPSFRYRYGKADELQRIVDEASGNIAGLETGAYGRITKRNGIPFSYDNAGRRTEDDRYHYKWNWRGELVEVTVKEAWSEGSSPFHGHQVRYQYDAKGRLHSRRHLGPIGAQGERQLLEKREYVWEGQSLLVEASYTDEAESQLQWRKTYVPGPSGLDDAVQVRVENFTAPGIRGSRLYTYLRDELGTVMGVVGEEENNDPAKPVIPARYLYTPYGEAHIEKALEVRRSRFEEAEKKLGNQVQTVENADERSEGALILTFGAALDASSLPDAVEVERNNGANWETVPAAEMLVGFEDATELKLLEKQGWKRGSSYRVRLTTLKDQQGRSLDEAKIFEWKIATTPSQSTDFSQFFAVEHDSIKAAMDTLGGRFPGGQNNLFQGLWTDPVTGINYARARWLDSTSAIWLSEDPLLDLDSVSHYSLSGLRPHSFVDPMGTAFIEPDLGPEEFLPTMDNRVAGRRPAGGLKRVETVKRESISLTSDGVASSPIVRQRRFANLSGDQMLKIRGIVVHQTGGSSADSTFQQYRSGVSIGAHFLIDLDGTIYQTSLLNQVAAHVGKLQSRCGYDYSRCVPGGSANPPLGQGEFALKVRSWKDLYALVESLKRRSSRPPDGPAATYHMELLRPYPFRFVDNNDSIGIEMVAAARDPVDGHIVTRKDSQKVQNGAVYDPATPRQNQSLTWLVRQLRRIYGLDAIDVYRHPEISYKNNTEASTAQWELPSP